MVREGERGLEPLDYCGVCNAKICGQTHVNAFTIEPSTEEVGVIPQPGSDKRSLYVGLRFVT